MAIRKFQQSSVVQAMPTPSDMVQTLEEKGLLPENYSPDSLTGHMFREALMRCFTDAASQLQIGRQHTAQVQPRVTLGNVVEGIKASLPDLHPATVAEFAIGMMKSYTKGIVQTPHPTEMLSRDAIDAELILTEILHHKTPRLLTRPMQAHQMPANERDILQEGLKNLFAKLSPIERPMTISEEMARSVTFSKMIFDAAPIVANNVLTAANTTSTQLNEDMLRNLFHIVQPETWSPGDRDSKPDMTVAELEKGIRLNRRAMMREYARQLLEVLDVSKGSKIDPDNDIDKNALHMLARLITTAQQSEDEERYKNISLQEYVTTRLKLDYRTDNEPPAVKALLKYLDDQDAAQREVPRSYETKEQMLDDLFALRRSDQFNTYVSPETSLSNLDALIVQTGNFGMTALHSQIRQNRDIHEDVFKRTLDLLKQNHPQLGNDAASVLEAMRDENTRLAMQRTIEQELIRLEDIPHCMKRPDEKAQESDFYFYQTLKGMHLATRNTEFVTNYLIAECDSAHDMLTATALLKLMEPPLEQQRGNIEIVPLVEHPSKVIEVNGEIPYVTMMKEVLSNKDFRDHHEKVSRQRYQHLLNDVSVEGKQVAGRRLTAQDVMRQINPEYDAAKHPEQTKDLVMAKLCMGAGSDVTKAGGIAAAALMQNAMFRLKEELLKLDDPVLLIDYIGCGGGVHRTQPVSSSYETVQGRSMRQTPEAIALKISSLLARHMRDRLATDMDWGTDKLIDMFAPQSRTGKTMAMDHADLHQASTQNAPLARQIDSKEKTILAQVNLGNMANLPIAPALWDKTTRELAERASLNYQSFTQSDEFKAYLHYTGDIFAKLTSYAARPTNRTSAAATEEKFPPVVQMEKLRAIGYGAALNACGSCASLYMGLGDIDISTPEKVAQLRQTYLHDPRFQDMINRATYGVIMTDLDTAWRYLGEAGIPDYQHMREIKSSTQTDQLSLAKRGLAKISQECSKVGAMLHTLHSSLSTNKEIDRTAPFHEQLISMLPAALGEQLRSSRENITLPRQALAELYRKFLSNNGQPVDNSQTPDLPQDVRHIIDTMEDRLPNRKNNDGKLNEYYTQIVYPSMAALMECFEHVPRAYTSPYWALERFRAELANGHTTSPH